MVLSGCSDHLSCKNICKLDVLMSMYDSTTFLNRYNFINILLIFFHLLLCLITVQWPLPCVYLYTKLEQRFVKSTRSWNKTLHFILINKGQCMVYLRSFLHLLMWHLSAAFRHFCLRFQRVTYFYVQWQGCPTRCHYLDCPGVFSHQGLVASPKACHSSS